MNLNTSTPSHRFHPLKPLIYSHLITSTPDSYQSSKRIKGILGYSEHYKGNRIVNANTDIGFPLQSRDYRKARELTLELWNPINKGKDLEKFLKSQKNIQRIKIRTLGKENRGEEEDLKQFWKALWRVHWLNRVHVDFDKEQIRQATPSLEIIRCMRPLPKLKGLAITLDKEEVYPFSASLLKVGFDAKNGLILVKDTAVVQKLVKRTRKFYQLDTLKVDSKQLVCFPDKFLEGLALVISKLPNFKELDFNYSRDLYLPLKQTFNILDTIAKAPKFEVLRLGLQMKGISQISLLKHPLLKAKSLKRTHLSLFLYREITPANLNEILDLLQGMPSLYELSLDFTNYAFLTDEIAEGLMRKVTEMPSVRKLKIVFSYHAENLSAKQAGKIFQWTFNTMVFLEELDLRLPKNGIDFTGNNGVDIQGLPRLVRASIMLRQCEPQMEKSIWGLVGVLGKCPRLRELDLDLTDSVYDFSGTPRKLFETFGKLKGLQVLKLEMIPASRSQEVEVSLLRDFMVVFGRMRNLQDWSLRLGISYVIDENERKERRNILYELESSKKYRFFDLGYSLQNALQNKFY